MLELSDMGSVIRTVGPLLELLILGPALETLVLGLAVRIVSSGMYCFKCQT